MTAGKVWRLFSVTLLNITNAGTMSAPGVLKIRRAEGEGLTNYQGELTPSPRPTSPLSLVQMQCGYKSASH